MNRKLSTYEMIASHYPEIKLRLHTPAHQGVRGQSEYFDDSIYSYDLPFFNRDKFDNVEKHISSLYKTKRTFFSDRRSYPRYFNSLYFISKKTPKSCYWSK